MLFFGKLVFFVWFHLLNAHPCPGLPLGPLHCMSATPLIPRLVSLLGTLYSCYQQLWNWKVISDTLYFINKTVVSPLKERFWPHFSWLSMKIWARKKSAPFCFRSPGYWIDVSCIKDRTFWNQAYNKCLSSGRWEYLATCLPGKMSPGCME